MKKLLFLIFGCSCIYFIACYFYRPNLFLNSTFFRGARQWKTNKTTIVDFDQAKKSNKDYGYALIKSNGELSQDIQYTLVYGQAYDLMFEANAISNISRLDFNIDNYNYAAFLITNTWDKYHLRFVMFDQKIKGNFRFIVKGNNDVELRNIAIRRSPLFSSLKYKEICGNFVSNLVKNPFLYDDSNWTISDTNKIFFTSYYGMPCVKMKKTNSKPLFISQVIHLSGQKKYCIDGDILMDDGHSGEGIAKINITFNDGTASTNFVKFSNNKRKSWISGSTQIMPKNDCEATITLSCEAKGYVFFRRIRVISVD